MTFALILCRTGLTDCRCHLSAKEKWRTCQMLQPFCMHASCKLIRLCHTMDHRGRHIGRPMVMWHEKKRLMWVDLCCSCRQESPHPLQPMWPNHEGNIRTKTSTKYCRMLSPQKFSINALPVTAESNSSPGCPQKASQIDSTNCSQHSSYPLMSEILLSCKVNDRT
jgi:hypothetical protein